MNVNIIIFQWLSAGQVNGKKEAKIIESKKQTTFM